MIITHSEHQEYHVQDLHACMESYMDDTLPTPDFTCSFRLSLVMYYNPLTCPYAAFSVAIESDLYRCML